MGGQTLSHSDLLAVLNYDPFTGIFTWRGTYGKMPEGRVAGHSVKTENRIKLCLFGTLYNAHRLAWFYVNAIWPIGEVDHINGNGKDNRIANLRDVSHAVNMTNERRARKNSSTGLLGVVPTGGGFRAVIRINGRKTFLGSFKTAEEAHARYITAKRLHHEGCTI